MQSKEIKNALSDILQSVGETKFEVEKIVECPASVSALIRLQMIQRELTNLINSLE
jgi:hypothetical protein